MKWTAYWFKNQYTTKTKIKHVAKIKHVNNIMTIVVCSYVLIQLHKIKISISSQLLHYPPYLDLILIILIFIGVF